MAYSVVQKRTGPTWPLGFISVANIGTPVNIMSLVDPSNTNSPSSASNNASAYTTTVRSIWFSGFKPGNNNNGMIPNTGYVYVLVPGNGSGNRTDPGCMVGVIPPGGGSFILPQSLGASETRFSPYEYTIDCDVNGEGALVTLIGPQGQ